MTPEETREVAAGWLVFRDGPGGGKQVGVRVDRVIARTRVLDRGTLCILGYYRDLPAMRFWNGPLMY
jgi:probable phosphoglycerate mutase